MYTSLFYLNLPIMVAGGGGGGVIGSFNCVEEKLKKVRRDFVQSCTVQCKMNLYCHAKDNKNSVNKNNRD